MGMKKYDVLATFKGSNDGRFTVEYMEGEVALLSDSLVADKTVAKKVQLHVEPKTRKTVDKGAPG